MLTGVQNSTPSLSLLTDLYQLTMAYGYWKTGHTDKEGIFNLFFRKNPFKGGYTITCGLTQAIEFLENFKFEESNLENFNQNVFPYDYDPAATCPTFDKIINGQFGEPAALAMNHGEALSSEQKNDVKEMKDYVQILNGLCLPGDNEQQIWVVNHGPEGRNGKSKIYEGLRVTMVIESPDGEFLEKAERTLERIRE